MIKTYALPNGHKIKVYMRKKGSSDSFFGTKGWHDIYTTIIETQEGELSTTFHNSMANYGYSIKEQNIDEAVDCIISDFHTYEECLDLADFINTYGYDFTQNFASEYMRAVRAYEACRSIHERLLKIMSRDDLNELLSIVRDEASEKIN